MIHLKWPTDERWQALDQKDRRLELWTFQFDARTDSYSFAWSEHVFDDPDGLNKAAHILTDGRLVKELAGHYISFDTVDGIVKLRVVT